MRFKILDVWIPILINVLKNEAVPLVDLKSWVKKNQIPRGKVELQRSRIVFIFGKSQA